MQSYISPLTEGEIESERQQIGKRRWKVEAGIETDGIRYSVRTAETKPQSEREKRKSEKV